MLIFGRHTWVWKGLKLLFPISITLTGFPTSHLSTSSNVQGMATHFEFPAKTSWELLKIHTISANIFGLFWGFNPTLIPMHVET